MKCSEKSCIFPATDGGGFCSNHRRLFSQASPVSRRPRTQALNELETIIERGFQTFIDVANALSQIYENDLFKEAGFATYVEYCKERWKLGTSAAYNYIRAKKVLDSMPEQQA